MIYNFTINKTYSIYAKSPEKALLVFFKAHNCKQEFLDNLELTDTITETNEVD